MNWNDLRYVLAIARGGTRSAAAASLGVDQTTVGRRLNALEDQLGTPLFLRSRHGFVPTETGDAILDEIELMETAALRLGDKVGRERQRPSGTVRIATMPWILSHLIAPALPEFVTRYPEIEVHGLADLRDRSLSRKEAEMSLRFELKPQGREIERPLAEIPYSVYVRAGRDPGETPWAGTAIDFGRFVPQSWLDTVLARENQTAAFRSDDAGILYSAVRSGAVKCLLPDVLAARDPALVRITEGPPDLVRSLRVLIHPDIEPLARVQCVLDWLEEAFRFEA